MTAKYQLIHAEEGSFPVRVMCRLLGIALSGYYAWKKTLGTPSVPGSRAAFRERLKELVWRLWDASQARFGFRRIRHRLAVEYNVHASEGLVRRVMRELGIEGVQPRARKTTTVPSPDAETRQDLVRRRFTPPVPTTHLVGDITYLKTGEGWLFLATVIDLTTRMVVGWQMSPRMTTDLATDALRMAHAAGYVAGGAVFHSDRGAQYTSAAYAEAASEMGVRLSVGRTGVCWDNAVAESFFATLKNEMFHRESFVTRGRACLAVGEYIEVFYNRKRPHSTIGYQTPAETMAAFFDRTAPELPAVTA